MSRKHELMNAALARPCPPGIAQFRLVEDKGDLWCLREFFCPTLVAWSLFRTPTVAVYEGVKTKQVRSYNIVESVRVA